jgi:hypothetical protein
VVPLRCIPPPPTPDVLIWHLPPFSLPSIQAAHATPTPFLLQRRPLLTGSIQLLAVDPAPCRRSSSSPWIFYLCHRRRFSSLPRHTARNLSPRRGSPVSSSRTAPSLRSGSRPHAAGHPPSIPRFLFLVRPILSSDCLMVCHRRANGCIRCRGTLFHYSISQRSLMVSSFLGTMFFNFVLPCPQLT